MAFDAEMATRSLTAEISGNSPAAGSWVNPPYAAPTVADRVDEVQRLPAVHVPVRDCLAQHVDRIEHALHPEAPPSEIVCAIVVCCLRLTGSSVATPS